MKTRTRQLVRDCWVAALCTAVVVSEARGQQAAAPAGDAGSALGGSVFTVEPARLAQVVQPAGAAAAAQVDEPSGFGRFMKDVGLDFKRYFSVETALWYGAGGAFAGLVHLADDPIRDALADPPEATLRALEGGDKYGNPDLQAALATSWWVVGHMMGSSRDASAGRDLARAQISATAWTYALKYAFDRDRPNGDPRSLPSGHSTATFATAMVLQQHYGWKIGFPFFALSTYTAISRITVEKHWASDVAFGAFVGIASGRAVTWHVRNSRVQVTPLVTHGGGGVAFVVGS